MNHITQEISLAVERIVKEKSDEELAKLEESFREAHPELTDYEAFKDIRCMVLYVIDSALKEIVLEYKSSHANLTKKAKTLYRYIINEYFSDEAYLESLYHRSISITSKDISYFNKRWSTMIKELRIRGIHRTLANHCKVILWDDRDLIVCINLHYTPLFKHEDKKELKQKLRRKIGQRTNIVILPGRIDLKRVYDVGNDADTSVRSDGEENIFDD